MTFKQYVVTERLDQVIDIVKKLNSLRFTGELNTMTFFNVWSLIKKFGGKDIAQGGASIVMGGDDLQYLVKINRISDPRNRKFVELSRIKSDGVNSLYPKVLNQFKFQYKTLSIYVMEYIPYIKTDEHGLDSIVEQMGVDWIGLTKTVSLHHTHIARDWISYVFDMFYEMDKENATFEEIIKKPYVTNDIKLEDGTVIKLNANMFDQKRIKELQKFRKLVMRRTGASDFDMYTGNYGFRKNGSLVIFDPVR